MEILWSSVRTSGPASPYLGVRTSTRVKYQSASRHCAILRKADRHVLDAGDDVRLKPFDFARQPDLLDQWEQRLEHQAQFKAREMRTGTKMLALAERNLLVRRAPQVETVGIIEDGV